MRPQPETRPFEIERLRREAASWQVRERPPRYRLQPQPAPRRRIGLMAVALAALIALAGVAALETSGPGAEVRGSLVRLVTPPTPLILRGSNPAPARPTPAVGAQASPAPAQAAARSDGSDKQTNSPAPQRERGGPVGAAPASAGSGDGGDSQRPSPSPSHEGTPSPPRK